MSTGKRYLIFLGWILTALLQIFMAAVVFKLSIGFTDLDIYTRRGWLLTLAAIWPGFTLSIYLVGWPFLAIRRLAALKKSTTRLAWVATGVLIPILILAAIGLTLDFTNVEKLNSVLFNNWQPKIFALAFILGLLGFHTPGWIRPRRSL